MKQKQSKRRLILLLNPAKEIRVGLKVSTPNQQVKQTSQGGLDVKEDQLTIRMTLELISRSLKAS